MSHLAPIKERLTQIDWRWLVALSVILGLMAGLASFLLAKTRS